MANNTFCTFYTPYYYLLCFAILLLSSCSQDESTGTGNDREILVPITINGIGTQQLKAIGDPTYTVDRILVLPLKKIDESSSNTDDNFAPDYTVAKQFDVNSFNYAAMLSLAGTSTYKVVVIGFNKNDYDIVQPNNVSRRFSILSSGTPVSLSNMYLQAIDATSIPEFFSATCTGFDGSTSKGQYFKPEDITGLTGSLTRVVSGLELRINNVPEVVTSVTLVAQQLVKAIKPLDGTPVLWQTAGDAENKTLGTVTRTSSSVVFSKYLLPTLDAHKTQLYLDITYGTITQRYTVKVPDTAGISTTNSITFSPNQVIRISGDYLDIDTGLVLQYGINLDDDIWDGITI